VKIVFMGTPVAAVPSLKILLRDNHEVAAVYTQPDRPSGRGNKISFSAVKEFAVARDLSVFQPEKIRTRDALELFKSHDADIAVVVAYGRILPVTFLNAFPNGAVNVHFSLLPKYRGAAPVNWAIVNGETETGVTTIQMDEGLDTGDIFLQRATQIGPTENSIELMERLSLIGADLLAETLRSLFQLEPRKQNDGEASFAPIMKKEDGLIDWKMTAKDIVNRVRGFQPFPTAYTYYQGKKITLWRAVISDAASENTVPGQVIHAGGNDLVVTSGSGSVKIEELQIEGKKRMVTRDFLNGVKIKERELLGGDQ
jgi:methionyl-tRNA formyltransferase